MTLNKQMTRRHFKITNTGKKSVSRLFIFNTTKSISNMPTGIFNLLLSIQNVSIARFDRNVEWDFFCDFQTPCTVPCMVFFYICQEWMERRSQFHFAFLTNIDKKAVNPVVFLSIGFKSITYFLKHFRFSISISV